MTKEWSLMRKFKVFSPYPLIQLEEMMRTIKIIYSYQKIDSNLLQGSCFCVIEFNHPDYPKASGQVSVIRK
jgi:hypothetical protein